ncbi:tnt-3, partial [Pristionchus pacificus]
SGQSSLNMSDEENGSEYEEEEEVEVEAEEVEEQPDQKEEEPEVKRRPVDDADSKIQDYEEKRRLEREREEEELRLLKEKQEKRKAEREEEERLLAERLKEQEERRRVEEEERKAKFDAEKKRREDEKKKREEMMASLTGKSFIIPPKAEKGDKFGNIVQAKQEMGMTKDQKEAAKRAVLQVIQKQLGVTEGLSDAEIKQKIKEMHSRIAKLETDKYDMEKRHERQEYDLKELNERSRQVARNAALKKGIDPADAGSSRHPAKKQIMSKYDRQIDRRNFNERKMMYETKMAYPVFPGLPPPPTIYEKIIKGFKTEEEEENERYEQRIDAEEEEEEEE